MQRLLGTPSTEDIEDLSREIVKIARDGGSVLLTGPQGSGKSAVLEAVRTHLTEVDAAFAAAPGSDRDPRTVVLVDDLARADDAILASATAHRGPVIASFDSGLYQRAYTAEVLRFAYGARPLGRDTDEVSRFHLDPLTAAEMARFLHEQSREPLDSAAVDAITALAMGRRSWALDLMQLHAQSQLQCDPFPSLNALLVPVDAPLPALQRVRRPLLDLPDEPAAAAVALSEIDPLDELGVATLVDSATMETLTSAGVLVPVDQEQTLTVPAFVAAALRQRSPLDLVQRWRQRFAGGLLVQERLGLRLSERDTVFCVRAWGTSPEVPEALAVDHRELVVRSVSRLTLFGSPARVRTAVMALGSHGIGLPPMVRVRAVAALGNTHEAIAALDAIDEDADPAEHVSRRLLRHVLATRAGLDPVDGPRPLDDAGELVLGLWNRVGPLANDATAIRDAAEHADPVVATLAALLADLDHAWAGLIPPFSASVQTPRPLPAMRLPAGETGADAVGTALVAQALVLLIAGESGARRDQLVETIARHPDAAHHHRWWRHLHAMATASAFGEVPRALTEWDLFAEAVPRTLPRRLWHLIERISAALHAAVDPMTSPDELDTVRNELPYRVLLYFSGLHGPLQRLHSGFESQPGTLPLVRLARAHLAAARERNPARLMRLAEHFETYQFWLASAYALSDARRIYLGRRANGKVRECDEALIRVRAEIARHAPWREPDVDPAVSLTPRELLAAQLAAQGLRNRDIAERLECGVRTVESHIAQARAKLGASTREDLARLLPRLDPL